jgi:hypothetical protein
MNIFFVLIPIFVFLVLYARWANAPRVMQWMGATPGEKHPEWPVLNDRIASLSHRHRLPQPRLWIFPEFSANALMLRSGGRLELGLTQGLVRALSAGELDCAISLCLTHGYFPGRAIKTRMALLLFPLTARFEKAPAPFRILLFPVVFFFLKIVSGPRAVLEADRRATAIHSPLKVAASLQKMGVLAEKIPPVRWNPALDSLFLLSPLRTEGGLIGSLLNLPSLAKRRDALLRRASCESAPSLP